MENRIELAYSEAVEFANNHYENFPVISRFVSSHLRKHVAVIYKFARDADDIVDEGDKTPQERFRELAEYESTFIDSINGIFQTSFWEALYCTINSLELTPQNFLDLLAAFEQDISKTRYKEFSEVMEYCKYSANPVGRLVLELHGIKNNEANKYSDLICSALQLANFYQDISVDIKKDRIYIPTDELSDFGVDQNDFFTRKSDDRMRQLVKYQVDRAEEMFNEGKGLLPYLPLKLKIQIRWTILGGMAILKKIKELDYNVLEQRPKLYKKDYFKLMVKALF